MIQRKQSVFLLLAAILAVVCICFRLEWIDMLLGASAALSCYTIFIYKQRPLQAKLCLADMVVLLLWYVLLSALEGKVTTVETLPMVACILVFMARKGINDDEKLVRAADRIR